MRVFNLLIQSVGFFLRHWARRWLILINQSTGWNLIQWINNLNISEYVMVRCILGLMLWCLHIKYESKKKMTLNKLFQHQYQFIFIKSFWFMLQFWVSIILWCWNINWSIWSEVYHKHLTIFCQHKYKQKRQWRRFYSVEHNRNRV